MQHSTNSDSDATDHDAVLKSTLITTVAALMVITTLFVTAFSSLEASASPAHRGTNAGNMVSVRYLA